MDILATGVEHGVKVHSELWGKTGHLPLDDVRDSGLSGRATVMLCLQLLGRRGWETETKENWVLD